jgi:hypothetical protein
MLFVFWSAVMNIECENLSVFVHYLPCSHGLILEAKKFRCEHACRNMYDMFDVLLVFRDRCTLEGPAALLLCRQFSRNWFEAALACGIGSV